MKATTARPLGTAALIPALLAGALLVGGGSDAGSPPLGRSNTFHLVSATEPTDGSSHVLRASDSNANFRSAYNAVINSLRQRSGSTTVYGDIRLTRAREDYFGLTLNNGSNQVQFLINAHNLYVDGYWNIGQSIYYRFGGLLDPFPASRDVTPRNWTNYTEMERAAGVDRGNLNISQGTIAGSIDALGSANPPAVREQARAALVLIQAFSEAARFDFISFRISDALRTGGGWNSRTSSVISGNGSSSNSFLVSGIDFQNNWSALSVAAQDAVQNGASPSVRIGQGTITTRAALDTQLVLALSRGPR